MNKLETKINSDPAETIVGQSLSSTGDHEQRIVHIPPTHQQYTPDNLAYSAPPGGDLQPHTEIQPTSQETRGKKRLSRYLGAGALLLAGYLARDPAVALEFATQNSLPVGATMMAASGAILGGLSLRGPGNRTSRDTTPEA